MTNTLLWNAFTVTLVIIVNEALPDRPTGQPTDRDTKTCESDPEILTANKKTIEMEAEEVVVFRPPAAEH